MKIVGLTGGIGSGKSEVARMFRELGAYVIDADELARRVVEPDKPAWRKIKDFFGEEVFNPDLSLNRKKLAEQVFGNEQARKKLEEITHPRIGEEILKELEKAKKKKAELVIIDAALLLESSLKDWVKPIILITAEEEIRIKRVCARDHCEEQEVRARIRNQAPDSERAKKADFIIKNEQGLKELREQVLKLYQELIQK